jgi:hypothetical protein
VVAARSGALTVVTGASNGSRHCGVDTGTTLALIGLVIACIGYRKLKKSIFKTLFAGENV